MVCLAKSLREQIEPVLGPEKAFGLALREFRLAKKISQERFALDSGLDRTYVSMLERGLKSPTIRTVLRLAEVLCVPASQIVLRTENLLERKNPS